MLMFRGSGVSIPTRYSFRRWLCRGSVFDQQVGAPPQDRSERAGNSKTRARTDDRNIGRIIRGEVIIYGVNTGILQVARYRDAAAVELFYPKESAAGGNSQILDLIFARYQNRTLSERNRRRYGNGR